MNQPAQPPVTSTSNIVARRLSRRDRARPWRLLLACSVDRLTLRSSVCGQEAQQELRPPGRKRLSRSFALPGGRGSAGASPSRAEEAQRELRPPGRKRLSGSFALPDGIEEAQQELRPPGRKRLSRSFALPGGRGSAGASPSRAEEAQQELRPPGWDRRGSAGASPSRNHEKPFRLQSIAGSNELGRTVSCIQAGVMQGASRSAIVWGISVPGLDSNNPSRNGISSGFSGRFRGILLQGLSGATAMTKPAPTLLSQISKKHRDIVQKIFEHEGANLTRDEFLRWTKEKLIAEPDRRDQYPYFSENRRSYLKDLYGCTDEEAEAMMVSEVYGRNLLDRGVARRFLTGDPEELEAALSLDARFEWANHCSAGPPFGVDYSNVWIALRGLAAGDIEVAQAILRAQCHEPRPQGDHADLRRRRSHRHERPRGTGSARRQNRQVRRVGLLRSHPRYTSRDHPCRLVDRREGARTGPGNVSTSGTAQL